MRKRENAQRVGIGINPLLTVGKEETEIGRERESEREYTSMEKGRGPKPTEKRREGFLSLSYYALSPSLLLSRPLDSTRSLARLPREESDTLSAVVIRQTVSSGRHMTPVLW